MVALCVKKCHLENGMRPENVQLPFTRLVKFNASPRWFNKNGHKICLRQNFCHKQYK